MYLSHVRIERDDTHRDIVLDLQFVLGTGKLPWLVLLWPCGGESSGVKKAWGACLARY